MLGIHRITMLCCQRCMKNMHFLPLHYYTDISLSNLCLWELYQFDTESSKNQQHDLFSQRIWHRVLWSRERNNRVIKERVGRNKDNAHGHIVMQRMQMMDRCDNGNEKTIELVFLHWLEHYIPLQTWWWDDLLSFTSEEFIPAEKEKRCWFRYIRHARLCPMKQWWNNPLWCVMRLLLRNKVIEESITW